MEQLEIYAALFCLEYGHKPGEIDMELRIYQNDEILIHKPEADDILPIMDHIVHLDKILSKVDLLSDKQTVIDSLKSIKQELENIKSEIEKYEREAMLESTYITEEVIKKEEEAYERRKRDSEIHIW
jgi:hypothetical protein